MQLMTLKQAFCLGASLLSLFVATRVGHACASYDISVSVLSVQDAFLNTELKRSLYTPIEEYYVYRSEYTANLLCYSARLGSSTEESYDDHYYEPYDPENRTENDPSSPFQDWKQYLNKAKLSQYTDALYETIKGIAADKEDESTWFNVSGKEYVPSDHPLAIYLKKNPRLLNYILKMREINRILSEEGISDPWYAGEYMWEHSDGSTGPTSEKLIKLIKQLKPLRGTDFIGQRYAYQYMLINNYYQNSEQVIATYNNYFRNAAPSNLKRWAGGLFGAHVQSAEGVALLADVYFNAGYRIRWAKDHFYVNDIEKTLQVLKSPKDQVQVYGLYLLKKDGPLTRKELKKLASLSGNDQIQLLIAARELSKLEQLRGPRYNYSDYTIWSDGYPLIYEANFGYSDESKSYKADPIINDWVNGLVALSNEIKPSSQKAKTAWELYKATLMIHLGNVSAGKVILAKVLADKTLDEYQQAQAMVMMLIAEVAQGPKPNFEHFKDLTEKLMKIADNSPTVAVSLRGATLTCRDILFKKNDPVHAIMVDILPYVIQDEQIKNVAQDNKYWSATGYTTNLRTCQRKTIIELSEAEAEALKSVIEHRNGYLGSYISKASPQTMAYLNERLSMFALAKGQVDQAVKLLGSIDESYWKQWPFTQYLDENPLTLELNEHGSFPSKSKQPYNKYRIALELQALIKASEAKHHKDARLLVMIGNMYENMSYFGNSWLMMNSKQQSSVINLKHLPEDESELLFHTPQADLWYRSAEKLIGPVFSEKWLKLKTDDGTPLFKGRCDHRSDYIIKEASYL